MNNNNRIENLRRKLAEKAVEAILVSQPDNLYYLTGCEGLEGYLLVTGEEAIIVTDFRYIEQAERQSPTCSIFRITGKLTEWFPKLFSEKKINNLGFESQHLSFSLFEQISEILKQNHFPFNLIATSGVVEKLRAIKDAEEIKLISQAARITESTLMHIPNLLHSGISEEALSWEIEKYMREHGSQTVPFEIIVAAGPNAALPHARPSDYIIRSGEPIVVDIGSKFEYYGSDLTRTYCVGQPDDRFKKIYDLVLKAQESAISRIEAGMTGDQADAIAREIITQAGYGEAFGHSLGHGIGLVTHENPRLGINSTDILEDGMVFTIEPGIYLSGWGGVRIEDDAVMANGKLKLISSAEK
jgi:Xaa-Pro aminopeptidase